MLLLFERRSNGSSSGLRGWRCGFDSLGRWDYLDCGISQSLAFSGTLLQLILEVALGKAAGFEHLLICCSTCQAPDCELCVLPLDGEP